jgi:hypothetical protein
MTELETQSAQVVFRDVQDSLPGMKPIFDENIKIIRQA